MLSHSTFTSLMAFIGQEAPHLPWIITLSSLGVTEDSGWEQVGFGDTIGVTINHRQVQI